MKKMKKMTLFLLLILLLVGCGNKDSEVKTTKEKSAKEETKEEVKEELNKDVKIKLKENLEVEINSDTTLFSFISEENEVEIISKDKKIDTSKLGIQELDIEYKEKENVIKETFKIKIVDTTKPEIKGVKDITITEGQKADLLKGITAVDNSKEELKIKVEGKYDFNKAATYKLKYTSTDSSGNKAASDFNLIVKKSQKPSTATSNKESEKNPEAKPENPSNPTNNNNDSKEEPSTPSNNKADLSEFILEATHKYQVSYNYKYVSQTTDFHADNMQELLNIIYTSLNEGATKFAFYCDYDNCINDLISFGNSGGISLIQDYIHPYNTLEGISYKYRGNYVEMQGRKKYSNTDINKIESIVNSVIQNNMNNSQNITDKLLVAHDYIVNNTTYGTNDRQTEHSAVGTLIDKKSVCEGYTHAMAIFAYKLGVPNYRISVPNVHTWNLVYVNGKWLHIDATWDDPVDASGSGKEYLFHTFFLVDGNVVKNNDSGTSHSFNKNVYPEG